MKILIASLLTAVNARDKRLAENVRRLRQEHPEAEIDLISHGPFPERWAASDLVTRLHTLSKDLEGFRLFVALVKLLRSGHYDLAVSIYESFPMQMALLFSGIGERYLYSNEIAVRLDFGEILLRNNIVFSPPGEGESWWKIAFKGFLRVLIICYGIILFSVLILYWAMRNRVNR